MNKKYLANMGWELDEEEETTKLTRGEIQKATDFLTEKELSFFQRNRRAIVSSYNTYILTDCWDHRPDFVRYIKQLFKSNAQLTQTHPRKPQATRTKTQTATA